MKDQSLWSDRFLSSVIMTRPVWMSWSRLKRGERREKKKQTKSLCQICHRYGTCPKIWTGESLSPPSKCSHNATGNVKNSSVGSSSPNMILTICLREIKSTELQVISFITFSTECIVLIITNRYKALMNLFKLKYHSHKECRSTFKKKN